VRISALAIPARRAAWEARTVAGRSPTLSRLLVRRSGELVTGQTEICIEGFPRCGNTFAVVAFQAAQLRTISIAHHVHAPGSVLIAVRMKKPAIVLVREPEEAVLSLMVRLRYLTAGQALRSYVGFYRPLLPHLRRLVVGRFAEVVSDFGNIMRQVNERFGTDFREFHPTEEHLRAVRDEVDRWDRGAFGSREGLERGGASPNELRDRLKEELRPSYRHPRLAAQRARAERVYRRFVDDFGTS
jgi:hypothetical protein